MPDSARADKKSRQTLTLLGLIGVLILVLAHSKAIEAPEIWRDLSAELGRALLIAALLGVVIDEALKRDLIRDAVSAALGYLLPQELKQELGWIYGQQVMASQSFHVRLEHIPKDRVVILHGTVQRKLTNKAGKEITVDVQGGVEEWFIPGRETKLHSCIYVRHDKSTGKKTQTNVCIGKGQYGLTYGPAVVPLAPEESIDVTFSYAMPHADHGLEVLSFRYPLVEPTILVEAPDSLLVSATFSHRTRYRDEAPPESGVISHRLEGVLLPHQDIRIYWHRKDVFDAWSRAI
jgi:hypothetical protein